MIKEKSAGRVSSHRPRVPPCPPKPKRKVVWEDERYDRPPGSWDNLEVTGSD